MAEKRKRLGLGRWLLLALVVLYFAPVISYTTPSPRCLAFDPTVTCDPGDDIHEWVSPSREVAGQIFRMMVEPQRHPGWRYETYTEEAAEARAGRARIGLFLSRLSTFRGATLNRRAKREQAFIDQYDGRHERASRAFEQLATDPRFNWPGYWQTQMDFNGALHNAFLAEDLPRLYALAERALEFYSEEDADGRLSVLLATASSAIRLEDLDTAEDWIERAVPIAITPQQQARLYEEQANLLRARYAERRSIDDADEALRLYSEALEIASSSPGDQPRHWTNDQLQDIGTARARLLSDLERCNEARDVIEGTIASLLPPPADEISLCSEPENGVKLETWSYVAHRCVLLQMIGGVESASVCAEANDLAARGCTDDRWHPDSDVMPRLEPTEPLACFVSDDDPDQGGAAHQADRG